MVPLKSISYQLVKVAKAHSYVETLGQNSDSLHRWIKESYEGDFKRAFEKEVRKAIRRMRITYAKLAFDITSEPFYGKTRGLYIFDAPPQKNYPGEIKFITVCLINRNKQIPLMALPVSHGSQTRLVIELLEFCKSLFKNIGLALFDRGFYIKELIDYLECEKIKYIILVPERRGRLKSYMKKTKELGKFEHSIKYSKNKSTWKNKTTIAVCKEIDEFSWIFATNIELDTGKDYVLRYKRRWQIETNYRVEDEARIKSKSTNYMIRYFYFLVSLLLHIFWIVNKNIKFYVPFKKYLDIIEQKMLFNYLGISSA
ncbi:MAG: transposase [Elusimicrobiota bacterium]